MLSMLQTVNLGAYLLAVVVLALQYFACRRMPAEAIAWGTWAIHGAVFYAVLFLDYRDAALNTIFYDRWSGALRLHGVLTFLMVEGFRYLRMRWKRKTNGC